MIFCKNTSCTNQDSFLKDGVGVCRLRWITIGEDGLCEDMNIPDETDSEEIETDVSSDYLTVSGEVYSVYDGAYGYENYNLSE